MRLSWRKEKIVNLDASRREGREGGKERRVGREGRKERVWEEDKKREKREERVM